MSTTALVKQTRRTNSSVDWSLRRQEEARVLKALEEMCDRESSGARIPTHTELMRQFNATERAVLSALSVLKQRGRIVRRHGSGTYVGNPGGMQPISLSGPDAASKTIVVIAKPDHGFFDECLSQLYSHADSRDYEIVYQLLRSQDGAITQLRPILGSAAGFILFGHHLAPLAKALMLTGNRAVIVGAPDIDEVSDVPCVCNDHEAGGYLVMRHLIEKGHRRIALPVYLASELRKPRWLGYRRAVDEAKRMGIAIAETMIELPRLEEWEAEPSLAREDILKPDGPTAIIAWNDFVASMLLGVLQRANIRVPEDVSIIGYDNSGISARLTPPLTTVDSGVPQLLSAAIRMVLMPKTAGQPATQMTIPNLVVRNSVSQPRAS